MSKKKKRNRRKARQKAATPSRYEQKHYKEGGSRYDYGTVSGKASRYQGSESGQRSEQKHIAKGSEDRNIKNKTERPKVELPKVELPKVDLPKVELPKISLPPIGSTLAALSAVRMTKKIVIGIAACALTVVYAAGAVHYSRYFYDNTTALGTDISGMNEQEAREQIEEKVGEYKLTVSVRGTEDEMIYARQVGLRYQDDQALAQALRAQRSYLWPIRLLQGTEQEVPVATVYDEEKKEEVLSQLPSMDAKNMTAPRDAYIDVQDNILTVVPEVMGTTLDQKAASLAVTEALEEGLTSVDLDEKNCYIDPKIYSDDETLNQEVDAKNQILGAHITYNFGDRTEEVDARKIESFMDKADDGSYSLSEEKVWSYVAQLADTYDTLGKEREFATSIGTTEVLYYGDYGWQIDQAETAQTLLNAIRDKQVAVMDPIYSSVAMSRNENDLGNMYVEICISRQEMWLYVDGEVIVDTPVVTGNVAKGWDTPADGIWSLKGKFTKFTLRGEGYATPVDYWMPFNGGVGIHDLQSRAYFGGSIYLTAGSHGCVNTPLAAVETIYDHVEVGIPVIVYS